MDYSVFTIVKIMNYAYKLTVVCEVCCSKQTRGSINVQDKNAQEVLLPGQVHHEDAGLLSHLTSPVCTVVPAPPAIT